MEGVDRLNELTDEMLVNDIISRLDCTTKEMITTTATISKRWKNLWTQLPNLIFSINNDITDLSDDDDICDYIFFIDNTLSQCPKNLNLQKFKLRIDYSRLVNPEFESRANSWISYAIRRNVEEVDLSLFEVEECSFTFEDELFFNTSCITRMTLSCCHFNPPNGTISWERLECLCLDHVDLDEDMMENILSGSPCLESLKLEDCFGFKRIDVTSKSVKKMVFSDCRNGDIDCIKINAPYISSLNIKGEFEVEHVLLDVSSLIRAKLGMSVDITHKEEMLRGLLKSLDHVKDVIINDFWWEIYSNLKACGDTSSGCSVRLKS